MRHANGPFATSSCGSREPVCGDRASCVLVFRLPEMLNVVLMRMRFLLVQVCVSRLSFAGKPGLRKQLL
jgi:hypothetical protein